MPLSLQARGPDLSFNITHSHNYSSSRSEGPQHTHAHEHTHTHTHTHTHKQHTHHSHTTTQTPTHTPHHNLAVITLHESEVVVWPPNTHTQKEIKKERGRLLLG